MVLFLKGRAFFFSFLQCRSLLELGWTRAKDKQGDAGRFGAQGWPLSWRNAEMTANLVGTRTSATESRHQKKDSVNADLPKVRWYRGWD